VEDSFERLGGVCDPPGFQDRRKRAAGDQSSFQPGGALGANSFFEAHHETIPRGKAGKKGRRTETQGTKPLHQRSWDNIRRRLDKKRLSTIRHVENFVCLAKTEVHQKGGRGGSQASEGISELGGCDKSCIYTRVGRGRSILSIKGAKTERRGARRTEEIHQK